MNAEIDQQGRLIVRPITQTEETALKAWQATAWLRKPDPATGEEGHWRAKSLVLLAHRPEAEDRH